MQRRQRVGNILKGSENRAAVLLGGLRVGGLRRPLLMQQRSAFKERHGCRGAQAPESSSRGEQLIHGECRAAGICAELDIGQTVGDRDADPGAGIVEIGLRLQYVRALCHEG